MPEDRAARKADPMIAVQGLSLCADDRQVIRDLALSVRPGEVFGLVGPIGSGKSSVLKLLAGMFPLAPGVVSISGVDPSRDGPAARRQIGYMPGVFGAYDDLTPRDYLKFFASACLVDPERAAPRIARLLDLAGLSAQADAYISSLDPEACRRLAVIKAAVHEPPVLLFDEPALGLSCAARIRLRELIGRLVADGGHTAVICSNLMTDVIGLCGRIGVMHGGQILTEGPTGEVARRLTGCRILECEVSGHPDAQLETIRLHPQIEAANPYGGHLLISIAGDLSDPGELIADLASRGVPVVAFREHQLDLDLVLDRLAGTAGQ